jgi:hypothetical protein
MNNKTKNFTFNTEEKDIFTNAPTNIKNQGGRPPKKDEERLSVQKTVKFTDGEHQELMQGFEKVKTQFSSFASYLRFLIFNKL